MKTITDSDAASHSSSISQSLYCMYKLNKQLKFQFFLLEKEKLIILNQLDTKIEKNKSLLGNCLTALTSKQE